MFKVYVDGQHGTTGLLVNERLKKHPEVEILTIPYESRHSEDKRKELLNQADVVFLCLPDDAAKEAVALIDNPKTKVIDASTAHRTNENWAYGFPELSRKHREAIAKSQWIANPGCHATATISAIRPLVDAGVLDPTIPLTIMSLTGYTGGGKKMIETYETTTNPVYKSPMQYGLNFNHKHVPEILKEGRLEKHPMFMPVVAAYPRGLAITLALDEEWLLKEMTKEKLVDVYKKHYQKSTYVRVHEADDSSALVDGKINVQMNNDTNYLDIFVYGSEHQFQVIACLDNLGKGASGAAIQNMNIAMGLDETRGL